MAKRERAAYMRDYRAKRRDDVALALQDLDRITPHGGSLDALAADRPRTHTGHRDGNPGDARKRAQAERDAILRRISVKGKTTV